MNWSFNKKQLMELQLPCPIILLPAILVVWFSKILLDIDFLDLCHSIRKDSVPLGLFFTVLVTPNRYFVCLVFRYCGSTFAFKFSNRKRPPFATNLWPFLKLDKNTGTLFLIIKYGGRYWIPFTLKKVWKAEDNCYQPSTLVVFIVWRKLFRASPSDLMFH